MTAKQELAAEREVFRKHYEHADSHWANHSGDGSNPYYTIEYRAFLEKFIRMNRVTSIADVGCGDWQFSRFMNFSGISYVGYDVVPSVIARNSAAFGSDSVRFEVMPESIEAIPTGDLLLIKDVLQHLPDEVIFKFERELFNRFKFVLLTNSFDKLNTARNIDIQPGDFRCLDLSAPPYSFPGCYLLEFSSPLWERIRTYLYRLT